jgi:hypothetical protein
MCQRLLALSLLNAECWLLDAEPEAQCSAGFSEECSNCQLASPVNCVCTEQLERPKTPARTSTKASPTEPVEN